MDREQAAEGATLDPGSFGVRGHVRALESGPAAAGSPHSILH
jgi:hypothetical protein